MSPGIMGVDSARAVRLLSRDSLQVSASQRIAGPAAEIRNAISQQRPVLLSDLFEERRREGGRDSEGGENVGEGEGEVC